MATGSIEPVFDTAPDVICPVGPLQAWFTDPPGAVVQLMEATQFNAAMARWLVGPGFDRLVERFPARGLLLVLDTRAMTGREPVVRSMFMDKAREDASTFSKVVVCPPVQINPVYLTALHAAAALVSAFGTQLEVTSDLPEVLARHGISLAS